MRQTISKVLLLLFAWMILAALGFPSKRIKITDGTGSPSGYPHELTFGDKEVTDDGDQTYTVDTGLDNPITEALGIIEGAPDGVELYIGGDTGISGNLTVGGTTALSSDLTMGAGTALFFPDGTSQITAGGGAAGQWTDTGTVLHPDESATDNVAIGGTDSTAPIYLQVTGEAQFSSDLTLANSIIFTDDFYPYTPNQLIDIHDPLHPGLELNWTNSGGRGELQFWNESVFYGGVGAFGSAYGDAAVENALGLTSGIDDNGYLFFRTKTGGSYYDRMRINNDGNVGIGTTAPTAKLDVNGDVNIAQDLTVTGSTVLATSYGNVGIGTTTPDAKLVVAGGMNINLPADDNITIDGRTNPREVTVGVIRINHTPEASTLNTRCLFLDVDANSVPNTQGMHIDLKATALAAGETVIGLDIVGDTVNSSGGVIRLLELDKTGVGSAEVHGIHIEPEIAEVIHHASGTFIDPTQGWDEDGGFTDTTVAFGSSATDVTIFDADNDAIYIGADAVFMEVEVILDTGASNPGIKPTFEIWTGSWTTITPVDNTAGFRESGVIDLEDSDLSSWVANTVNSVSKFYLQITRTQNSLGTDPIEDLIQTAAVTDFIWDESGNLNINTLGIGTSAPAVELDVVGEIQATSDLTINGTIFGSENMNIDSGTLYVDSVNDRVGVGTTAPSSPLTVNYPSANTSLTNPILKMNNPGGNQSGLTFTFNDTIQSQIRADSGGSMIYASKGTQYFGYYNDFNTYVDVRFGDFFNPYMIIKAAGNVGIGTSTPATALQVVGTITGDVTGDLTGTAADATILETARTIAGVSFDGSANIAIASTGLSDTAALLYETELDDFSELQTQIGDKTLVNEEDAATWDSAHTFSSTIASGALTVTGAASMTTDLTVGGSTHFNGVAYNWPVADGSATNVLTTNGANGLSWETAGAGASYREYTLLSSSAILDDDSPPAITIVESTGTGTPRFRVADFDASSDEIIYWTLSAPSDMASGDWEAVVYWYANDVGPNEGVAWAIAVSATSEGDADDMEEQAVDTANVATEDVNETEATRLMVTTITMSNLDSAAAGDNVTMQFFRDISNAADDLTSDARLVQVRLKIPRE